MRSSTLLESIWKGDVLTSKSNMCQEVTRLLGLILPLRTVPLSAKSGISRSCIVSEQIELLPEVLLGDVVAEELSADVPYGAMIVIFKEQDWSDTINQTDVSFELGLLIGDTLLNLIKDCVFPLQYEAEVLLVMVNSYCRLIESPEFQSQKVCSESFNEGLILSLREYWDGQVQKNMNKTGAAYHERFGGITYPKTIESYVGKHVLGQRDINLTKLHRNIFTPNDWKRCVSEAVMGEIHKDSMRVNNY